MASSPGGHEVSASHFVTSTSSSCLTIYELYQIEQYEAQEIYEFEQYVKIIQFAEAVHYGIHPRVKIFPRPPPRAHTTFDANVSHMQKNRSLC